MTGQTNTQLVTTEGEAGLPLDRLLLRHLPDMNRNKIRAMLAHGRLRLNGSHPAGPAVILSAGDTVDLLHSDPDSPSLIFEDAGFLMVYKPAGVEAAQALRTVACLHSRFHRRFNPRLVETLEQQISGAAVATADPRIFRQLAAAFSGGRAVRRYQALVSPAPALAAGPLPGAPGWFCKQERRYQDTAFILLSAPPRRGSRPLIALAAARLKPLRLVGSGHLKLAVHSSSLSFCHPRNGRRLHYDLPLPRGFRLAMDALEPLATLPADVPAEAPHPPARKGAAGSAEPALRSPNVPRRPARRR
jgi:23S rRNA-/tRNA-specific pseudouridylate synthase